MDKSLILNKIKEYLNIRFDKDFADFLAIKTTTLSMWYKRNTYDVELLFKKCEFLNSEWLLTGEGPMLKSINGIEIKDSPVKKPTLPRVSVEAVGGSGNNAFSFSEEEIMEYISVPSFTRRKADFIIAVSGSSMRPKYSNGDLLACRIIKENSFIEWNKPHVVATTDRGIIVKRIKKGSNENSLTMVSEDSEYDPFEVPKEEITGIAIVIGVIRLE